MAAFLRHQDSNRVQHGFMWELLHFFDLHHYFHRRELRAERKCIDGKQSKNNRNSSCEEEHELLIAEDVDRMEGENLSESDLKCPISKKMFKKEENDSSTSHESQSQNTSTKQNEEHVMMSVATSCANTELFHKVCQDSSYLYENTNQEDCSWRAKKFSKENGLQENNPIRPHNFEFLPSSSMFKYTMYGSNSSGGFKDFKIRMKEVIKNAKNEGKRVSLDGVLHKNPLGPKDSSSRKYGFTLADNKPPHQRVRRSLSLTSESLEKYNCLLESRSFKQSRRLHVLGAKPSQEGDFLDNKPARRWGRTISNPEFFRNLDNLELDDEPTAKNPSLAPVPEQHIFEPFKHEQLLRAEEKPNDIEDTYPFLSDLTCGGKTNLFRSEEKSDHRSSVACGCSDYSREAEIYACATVDEDLDCQITIKCQELSEIFEILDDLGTKDLIPKSAFDYSCQKKPVKSSPLEENLLHYRDHGHSHLKDWDSDYIKGLLKKVDHQLLFDLINEILSDTFSISSSFQGSLSHFPDSRIQLRSATQPLIVKKLSMSINWYLSYESRPNSSMEHVVVRDFSRQDGWMNIREDSGILGLELEAWVLDDLMDEALADLQVLF